MTEDIADGYMVALEVNPWWSSSPAFFPLLPLAPRGVSLVQDLSDQPLEKLWPTWSFYDKLNCLTVVFSSCAPFFNKTPGDDLLVSSLAIEASLNSLMKRLLVLVKDSIDNAEPIRLSALVEKNIPIPVKFGTNLATATLFAIPEEKEDESIASPHRKRKMQAGGLRLS